MKRKYHNQFLRFIKKQNNILYKKIEECVNQVLESPLDGNILDHPFRRFKIRRIKFSYNSIEYRIAYVIQEDCIYFLAVGTRENFYEKLKNML